MNYIVHDMTVYEKTEQMRSLTHVQLIVLRIVQHLHQLHHVWVVQLLHDGDLSVYLKMAQSRWRILQQSQ